MDGGRISYNQTFRKTAATPSGTTNAGKTVQSAEGISEGSNRRKTSLLKEEGAAEKSVRGDSKSKIEAASGRSADQAEASGAPGRKNNIAGGQRSADGLHSGQERILTEESKTADRESRGGKEDAQPLSLQPGDKYQQVMAQKAVENANQRMHSMGTSAKFDYNEDINRITITISDKENKEVIREIPPKETQKVLERIHMMTGMLMDTEA